MFLANSSSTARVAAKTTKAACCAHGELNFTEVKGHREHELTSIILHVSPHFSFLGTMSKGTVANILTFFSRSNMVA